MNLNDLIDRFAPVSGLEPEEISKYLFIICDCIKYFESRMGDKVYSDNDLSRLSHACAIYAYYKYSVYKTSVTSEKFKAGDVEFVTSESQSNGAKNMWEHEKSEIGDLIDFGDFCFIGVSV